MYGNIPRNDWPTVPTPERTEEQERQFRNKRLAEKDAANSPWDKPRPAGPGAMRAAANTPWNATKTQETGPRDMIRCHLPAGTSDVRNALYTALADIAGGFTVHTGLGLWKNPETGHTEIETVNTFEVSFTPNKETKDKLIAAFETAGRDQGEIWTHLEYYPAAFVACHKKTN